MGGGQPARGGGVLHTNSDMTPYGCPCHHVQLWGGGQPAGGGGSHTHNNNDNADVTRHEVALGLKNERNHFKSRREQITLFQHCIQTEKFINLRCQIPMTHGTQLPGNHPAKLFRTRSPPILWSLRIWQHLWTLSWSVQVWRLSDLHSVLNWQPEKQNVHLSWPQVRLTSTILRADATRQSPKKNSARSHGVRWLSRQLANAHGETNGFLISLAKTMCFLTGVPVFRKMHQCARNARAYFFHWKWVWCTHEGSWCIQMFCSDVDLHHLPFLSAQTRWTESWCLRLDYTGL